MAVLCLGLCIFILYGLTDVKLKHTNVLGWLYKLNTSPSVLMMVLYLIVLMGGSSLNSDTKQYTWIWQYDFFSKDPGFGLIVLIAKKIGITLVQFRLIIAIVGIFLIYRFCRKYLSIRNQKIFLLLYLIYPFLWDATQLRNFIGMAIFINGFSCLASNTKSGAVRYLLMTMIAASMQKVFVFFIPLVFYNRISQKIALRSFTIICAVFAIILGIRKDLVTVIASVLLNTISDKLTGIDKFLSVHTRYGWTVHWAMALLTSFLLYECKKKTKYYKNAIPNGASDHQFVNLAYWTSIYCIAAFPLYVLSVEFFRIERNIHLILLVSLGIVSQEMKCEGIRRSCSKLSIEVIAFLLLIVLVVVFQYLYDYSIFHSFIGYWKYNWIVGGSV